MRMRWKRSFGGSPERRAGLSMTKTRTTKSNPRKGMRSRKRRSLPLRRSTLSRPLPRARQFFIRRRVEDFELFSVNGGIAAEGEFAEIALLHFDEKFFVFSAQPLQQAGMNN